MTEKKPEKKQKQHGVAEDMNTPPELSDTKKHTLYKTLEVAREKVTTEIKDKCEGKKKFVIWIAQIDPDAIGSAMVIRYYLMVCLNIDPSYIQIYYGGAVSHAQNRCIFNIFELDNLFQRISCEEVPHKEEEEIWFLVDSNDLNDSRFSGMDLSDIDIIIDHHRISAKQKTEDKIYFIDSIGSASTLTVELLETECSGLENLPSDSDREKVLTLASIGIRNDTNNFTSALTHTRDTEALNKLIPFIDNDLTIQVENYPLDNNYFSILSNVLETRKVKGIRAIASAGYIYEEDGDQLAEACNLLIREARVSIAVVWGIILETGRVRLSIRSKDVSLNLDSKLKEVFEGKGGAKQTKGVAEGGVHLDMGDFVPSGPLKDDETYKEYWRNIIEANITGKISLMLKDSGED